MLNVQKQLSDVVVSCQNTADYFLSPGKRTVKKRKRKKKGGKQQGKFYQCTSHTPSSAIQY